MKIFKSLQSFLKEKKDRNDQLSCNFRVREFLHPETEWHDLTREQQQNIKQLVIRLEKMRVLYNRPFIINTKGRNNAGFRTIEQNAKVGGAKNSYHMKGMAADVYPVDIELRDFALTAKKFFGGVITYPANNFVHVDMRDLEGKEYYNIR